MQEIHPYCAARYADDAGWFIGRLLQGQPTPRGACAPARHAPIVQCFLPGVSLDGTKKMMRTTPVASESWRPDTTRFYEDGLTKIASSRNLRCAGSISASKRPRRAWLVASTGRSGGMKAVATGGYGEWLVGTQGCSSIGVRMVSPAVGQWEPCESRGSCRVLREAGGATPPPAH
jgi:hypothetical protein